MKSYQFWALLSALFAGVTAVLAKKGVESVPTNLAVAIRVFIVLAFASAIAVASGQVKVNEVPARAWVFLTLSGIATGLSWICYFKALSMGSVAEVAPIDKLSFVIAVVLGIALLRERPTLNLIVGCVLIVAGVVVTLR